jgi:SAICAR synthetase
MASSSLHVLLLLDPATVVPRSCIVDDLQALGVDATANCQVQIRSSNMPLDRLLDHPPPTQDEMARPPPQSLMVVWARESSSILYFRDHAPFPVIFIDNTETRTETAALSIAKFVSLYSPMVAAKVRRRVESIRQAALVEDSIYKAKSYVKKIEECLDHGRTITGDSIRLGHDDDTTQQQPHQHTFQRFRGKVRDRWESTVDSTTNNICAMVTTDRQSGFDRQLAIVPFKGAVLNLCSQFWFRETSDIIPNHLLSVPHPAVAICQRCQPFPIEFVVRYVFFVTT